MQGSNSTLDMRLRTKVRGLSRWGTLCGVLAMMTFVAGCPLFQPRPPQCETAADCPDDGNFCTGARVCQENGRCGFAGNPCFGATPICVEETDSCVECTQNSHCDEGEVCSNNVCVQACEEAADCDDDGLFCTGDPVCDDGLCDTTGNPCGGETPVCVEATDECVQCVDDGDCAEGETCTDNVCVPDVECEVDADCDDDNLCTTDECVDGACVHTQKTCPQGQSCNPANGNCEEIACTSDADCDDGLACTLQSCNVNTGICSFVSVDALCDDGQFCTGDATCEPDNDDADANGCVFTGNPCLDANGDPIDPTEPICDEAAEACVGCQNNEDCAEAFSIAACETASCNEGTGVCTIDQDDEFCDDGLFCTGDATCDPEDDSADANGCVFTGDPCLCADASDPCGADAVAGGYLLCSEDANDGEGGCLDCEANADCNDGIACTGNLCNGTTGVCTNPPNDALCDDGLFCTADDTCDPDNPNADANGCVNETNPCDPMLCEEGEDAEVCVNCMSNEDCQGFDGEDDIDCTESRCNGVTGECVNVPVNANCGAGEVCDAVLGCLVP